MELTENEVKALLSFLWEFGELDRTEIFHSEQIDVLAKLGYFKADPKGL